MGRGDVNLPSLFVGISGVYNYPMASTGAGRYTARVYLMAQDGTFTQVDSAPVMVTE